MNRKLNIFASGRALFIAALTPKEAGQVLVDISDEQACPRHHIALGRQDIFNRLVVKEPGDF